MELKDLLRVEEIPSVSIITVNHNGKKYLEDCLNSLLALNYPQEKLETILVDNGSDDDSPGWVSKNYPQVQLMQNEKNVGYAKAINQGARKAKGKYLAFLNNDMRVDPNWLVELLVHIVNSPDVACVGSKTLTWDGSAIDFADSALSFYGHGFKLDTLTQEFEAHNQEKSILFVCGGAMLVDKEIYFETGGFDEDYFAFYEDVDFGWRLWVMGYRVIFAPKSVAYHHVHGTASQFGDEKEKLLLERNAIYTIYKNYEENNLQRILPVSLMLTLKRGIVEAGIDCDSYEFKNRESKNGDNESISRLSFAHFLALDGVIQEMPRLIEKRESIQSRRKRSDSAIFHLFKEPFRANIFESPYTTAQEQLTDVFGIRELYDKRNRILIISTDAVAKKMAGPAIRCWEFAKVLSQEHEVVLAIPNETDLDSHGFQVESYRGERGAEILNHWAVWCDVLICQGFVLNDYPFLQEAEKPIVVDIYDPLSLEILELYKYKDLEERVDVHQARLSMLNEQLKIGDFFICSSEKQRDFWIGCLSSLNRVNPYVYDSDKSLRSFIDVIPFGLPAIAPRHSQGVLKGVHENMKEEDSLVLWAGGIYNWFDPLTLIRALGIIAKEREDVKLFFMGMEHPNPDVSEMEIVQDTIDLSKELGLYEKQVFFNFGWVPYEERQNYLLEADIGVTTHLHHMETEYSFRTRIMDYIWVSLPMVSTKGGPMSEMIEKYQLGMTVDAEKPDELASALLELLDNPELYRSVRENIRNLAPLFIWDEIAEPLRRFCSDPRLAPDKYKKDRVGESQTSVNVENNGEGELDSGHDVDRDFGYYLERLAMHYRNGGFRSVVLHSRDLLSRLMKP